MIILESFYVVCIVDMFCLLNNCFAINNEVKQANNLIILKMLCIFVEWIMMLPHFCWVDTLYSYDNVMKLQNLEF